MACRKDYYQILDLPLCAPRQLQRQSLSSATLRRSYHTALLAAHPDKKRAAEIRRQGKNPTNPRVTTEEDTSITIDDIKEAYIVLSNAEARARYDDSRLDRWCVQRPEKGVGFDMRRKGGDGTEGDKVERGEESGKNFWDDEFQLGLEVLDLCDFSTAEIDGQREEISDDGHPGKGEVGSNKEKRETLWIRNCLCGARSGFKITEGQLEIAERDGATQLLVGCEGCSLWVKVGFMVEDG